MESVAVGDVIAVHVEHAQVDEIKTNNSPSKEKCPPSNDTTCTTERDIHYGALRHIIAVTAEIMFYVACLVTFWYVFIIPTVGLHKSSLRDLILPRTTTVMLPRMTTVIPSVGHVAPVAPLTWVKLPFGPIASLVWTAPLKAIITLAKSRSVSASMSCMKNEYSQYRDDLVSVYLFLRDCRTMAFQERFISFCQGMQVFAGYLFMYGYLSLLVKGATFGLGLDWYGAYQYGLVTNLAWWLKVFAVWQVFSIASCLCMHRFFAHRSFETSRLMQFLLAVFGATSWQRGALWWASTHRKHHQFCDTPDDYHSPKHFGFLFAHIGWLLERPTYTLVLDRIEQYHVYPELFVVEMFSNFVAMQAVYFGATYIGITGAKIALGMSLHTTWFLNSVCHMTEAADVIDAEAEHKDQPCHATDVWWVGVLNGGDGHHGAHHDAPGCAKHGRAHWANIDITYSIICVFESLGLAWNVQHPGQPDTRKPFGGTMGHDVHLGDDTNPPNLEALQ